MVEINPITIRSIRLRLFPLVKKIIPTFEYPTSIFIRYKTPPINTDNMIK